MFIPGGCYHIIGRGLERRYIFEAAVDKLDFLVRLEENLKRTATQCFAWALMSNHYHLLIRCGTSSLDRLMAPILGGFAGSYNRRRQRCGYVFQNRFQSILCEEESYFLELVRYIHLNPLRAGLVQSLGELDHYRWTGHSAIVGNQRCDWLVADEVLCRFGTSIRQTRKNYRGFIEAGINREAPENLSGGGLVRSYQGWEAVARLRREHTICIGDERILGSSDFVDKVVSQDDLRFLKHESCRRKGWTFDVLRTRVCAHCGVNERDIQSKARAVRASHAKTLLCYLAVEELGISVTEVARELGISQQAVSKRVKQGQSVCCDPGMKIENLGLSC